MPHQTIHIHPEAPAKPALGAPCNGCGVCCLAEPCPLGRVISRKRVGACDALRWDGAAAQYRCGAITDAAGVLGPRWAWAAPLLRRLARRWIAAGAGCDASLEAQAPAGPR
ncbi:MAG: hypothetical protein IBJ04_10790 [Hydrogenophaga sp.]|uniref:4Fe-4S ferredoxin-type domain-containing protein n=1 Tax=Hydrogenophaga crocea TaxID=2716225 RepID=A0A6G8ILQ8_9BURK|nr:MULTISPECIES: hypothetical protein [Hydrogenophaga]MBL0944802.1 hypothetical protein [Hydrogenophaga sp.]QIM54147.1 hypothetical protein G9Q37_19320 [Hydrogenophaga crocea]